MSPATKLWLKRAAIVLAAITFFVLVIPRFMGATLGFGISAVAMFGSIAILAGLPFLAWIVFGAGYKIFLKPYVRAWHINRIRNQRDLREATNRNP